MHLNIHYLIPKFEEIKHFIDQHQNLDILGLCETFLNDYFSDNELQLNNYQLFRKDRKSHGGGLLLYVKSQNPCLQRTDLENDTLETIWLEMKLPKQKSFLVCYVYRPPSSSVTWNTEFEHSLEKGLD